MVSQLQQTAVPGGGPPGPAGGPGQGIGREMAQALTSGVLPGMAPGQGLSKEMAQALGGRQGKYGRGVIPGMGQGARRGMWYNGPSMKDVRGGILSRLFSG